MVNKTVLAGGLTVVSERIPSVRSVSFGVWVGAGSHTDDMKLPGMAHFIEHMLFKGTETRSAYDIAHAIESLGGDINAFTSRNLTCYYVCVLDEYFESALEVLADILTHSVFRDEDIELEKNVVCEEIRSINDVPEELVQDEFIDMVLNPFPESKPVLGTLEAVSSISRNEILKYLTMHYTAPNIVIAVAGNIDHERITELVARYFTFAEKDSAGSKENTTRERERIRTVSKDISQAHICYGGNSFGYSDSRRLSLLILNTILGSGMSSRLFQNIREKNGLTYSIYSFTELFKTYGVMATYVATDVINVQKVLELVHEEYSRLREERIDIKTLSDAQSHVKGSIILNLESTMNRMNRLAKNEIYLGKYCEIDDTLKQIDRISTLQIMNVAEEIFKEDNLFTVIITPCN